MGKKYMGRVGQLIRRKVTTMLMEQSNDPRLAEVTITDVQVNRDTSRAEIFYSLLGGAAQAAQVQSALDGAAGWLRAELAPTLRLRNLPRLVFTYDPSLEYGAHIDEVLAKLHDGASAGDAVVDDEYEDDEDDFAASGDDSADAE